MAKPPVIPGVELQDIIGAGSASTVYGGTYAVADYPVAVKYVAPRAGMPLQMVQRALQEAELSFALNHPNIVRVIRWGMCEDGGAYLIMERLSGETLADRLLAKGQLPVRQVVRLGGQIARALGAIHARGALHRDIKPENIFICDNGPTPNYVKVLDLGIARVREGDPTHKVATAQGIVLGTPGFIAPECIRGEVGDHRSDLYAFGATLYAALTGRVPHDNGGSNVAVLAAIAKIDRPPPMPEFLPPELSTLLNALLDPDPRLRPSTVGDAQATLAVLTRVVSSEAAETVVTIADRTVQVAALRLPSLGQPGDHERFRNHVTAVIEGLYHPSHVPPRLKARRDEVERLLGRMAELRQRAGAAREEADALAKELDQRDSRLVFAMDALKAARDRSREAYLQCNMELMGNADRLATVDRRYGETYKRVEALQRDEAARATSAGEPTSLEGLYGDEVRRCLAELQKAHDARAALVEAQRDARNALRKCHREISDFAAQLVELERSRLGIEAERHTRAAAHDDAAQAAEDDLSHCERALEHAYVRLGVALQLELAGEPSAQEGRP